MNRPVLKSWPPFLAPLSIHTISLLWACGLELGYFQSLPFFYLGCCDDDKVMVKLIKPGFVVEACNFSTWEAETRGSRVQIYSLYISR